MIEICTPVARLVGGHPMHKNPVVDDRTKPPTPKYQADGVSPRMSTSIGIAIPKAGETHWNQTTWGAQFHQEAVSSWPNGEYNSPSFAWKVTDGDSQIPNKRGKKPADQEGYPGHWVVWCSTELDVKSYHAGKYDPAQQIQNKNEIKAGDYCRVVLTVKGNNPSESPGVYVNPHLFELTRAGQEIQLGSGPVASEAFGGAAPQLPPGALVAGPSPTPGPTPGPTPVPSPTPGPTPVPSPTPGPTPGPSPTPAAPVEKFLVQGVEYTREQLIGFNWTPEQIAAAPKVTPPPVTPAPEFLNGPQPGPTPPQPEAFMVQGTVYTREQLVGFGWTPEQIAAAEKVPF